jgi:hypothetical protein
MCFRLSPYTLTIKLELILWDWLSRSNAAH